MCTRVRRISSHGMILMLSRSLGIETSSAWTLRLLSSGTLPWSPIWYLIHCLHNEKYGLQSNTWYTVCTMRSMICSLIPDTLSAQWEVWSAVWYLIHCLHNEKYGLQFNTWYTVCTMRSMVCSLIPDTLSAQWEVWSAVWYLIHCLHNEKYGLKSDTWYTVCTMRIMVCSLIPDILSAQWEVRSAVWYLIHCLHNEKYDLQSDTWCTVCTMINNCLRPVVPKLLQGLPPAVRQRLCFNKMELVHGMGNITHSGWTRKFYFINVEHGVWSLDTLRHCKWHVPKKGTLSGYILCNISDLLCNKESD